MLNRSIPLMSVDEVDSQLNTMVTDIKEITEDAESSQSQKVVPIFDDAALKEAQERIANNASVQNPSELKLFFTKDKNLLDQYYTMRAEAYRKEWQFGNFDNSETVFDKQGHILVAMKGDELVGGMRIMYSNECDFLSNEIPGTQYDYAKFIKKYDQRDDLVLAEISALVVKEGNRDSTVSAAMLEALFKAAEAYGCHYVFGVTVALVCRRDRRTLKSLGYDVEIVINFPWKEKRIYNFVKMFPMYCKLK